MTPEPLDVVAVMREVAAEARDLRASGRLGGLEHELEALFDSLAPPAGGGDFEALLEELDRTSFIEPAAPVDSELPAGAAIKKTIRRLTGWQLEPLTRQITAFDHAVSSALRQVDKRLAALEARLPTSAVDGAELPPPVPDTDWSDVVTEAIAAVPGRVLVVATGASAFVGLLRPRGVDAYGVDPSSNGGDENVRGEEMLTHLSRVADAALGAAVIIGWADRADLDGVTVLADHLARTVRAGGRIILTSVDPRTWAGVVAPIVADLSPGRPLHPDTWKALLGPRGVRVERVEWRGSEAGGGGGEYALVADRAD